MKRIWAIICLIVLLAMILGVAISCRKDVFVAPPPSIIGTYRGTYEYFQDNLNGSTTDDLDTSQFVKVIFKADTWIMNIDNAKTSEDARMVCDCNGDYTLENGVQLVLVDSNATNKVCTYSWLPEGSFQLIQDETDTLCSVQLTRIFTYTDPNNRTYTITKQLCLYPSIL